MLLSILLIFVVFNYVENFEMWLKQPFKNALEYYLNYIPQIIYQIMPIIMLLTTIITLSGMARHLEITAMKCAGVSVPKISISIIVVALLVTGSMYYLVEEVLPDANHRRLELAQLKTKKKKNRRDKHKYQYLFIGANGSTYYFQRYYASSKMARDAVILFFNEGVLTERIEASKMTYRDSVWRLTKGRSWKFFPDSVQYSEFKIKKLKDRVPERPADFLDTRYSPEEMSSTYIKRRIEIMNRIGEKTFDLQTELYSKLAGCFVNFFVTLIALALAHPRIRGGVSLNFAIGLLLAFSYYVIIKIGVVLGQNGAIPPLLGAWFGNIIYGVLGMILFIRSVRL